MDSITNLFEIDYFAVFVSIFTILFAFKAISSLFEWVVTKWGLETKQMRKHREEHDLLIATANGLNSLSQKHEDSVVQSIRHDRLIKEDLSSFIKEIKDSIGDTQNEIKHFAENRVHDREQSFEIQKQLTDAINVLAESGSERTRQMDSLIAATKESLGDRINQKYKYYLSLRGIPEDELDEFTSLHTAYAAVGGNHSGDAKYKYCMENLPVIPVEIKLKYNE